MSKENWEAPKRVAGRREGKDASDGAAPGDRSMPVKDILDASQRAVEELRGRVDAGVKTAVEAVSASGLLTEVEKLQAKLRELEKKIEQLTK